MPPGSVIGILGGGQLGRMIALAAAPMGYRCAVLTPEADSPASQVAWQTVVAPYDDAEALARFAGLSDVVTLEFENVPAATVTALAARVRTAPQDRVLAVTQDRLKEKTLARDAGLATVAFAAVHNGDLSAMTETIGFPAILKTRRMGYDGKGQRRVESLEAGREACRALGDSLIAEAVCPFDKELSVIVARSARGEIRAFDAVENEHENPHPADDLGAGACPRCRAARGRGSGLPARRTAVARRLAGRRVLLVAGSGAVGQRNGAAPAQFRPLDDRGLPHQPVRAACPGDLRPAAGRPRPPFRRGDDEYSGLRSGKLDEFDRRPGRAYSPVREGRNPFGA